MKRFLTSTALALTLGTAAIAESHAAMDWSAAMEPQAGEFYGSDLIGMRIYRAETDYDNCRAWAPTPSANGTISARSTT